MMNTTDSQRGAIIGELEEMLAQSQSAGIQRGPSFEVSSRHLASSVTILIAMLLGWVYETFH